jgi:putative transposase
MIEYKSKICGIKIIYIDPKYTSQKCSKCGLIGNRNGKKFVCSNENCKHVDHADSNAAFNIAAFELNEIDNESNDQSATDRDVAEGSTDTPKLETQRSECESMNEVA